MRVSSKGDYALKAMLELSKNDGKNLMTITALSNKAGVPKKFLEHILIELKKGGFVDSRRGILGGYSLTRAPSKIKLGDVIETIEGPIDPQKSTNSGRKKTELESGLVFDHIWKDVADSTLKILNSVTFEDLLNRVRSHDEAIHYMI